MPTNTRRTRGECESLAHVFRNKLQITRCCGTLLIRVCNIRVNIGSGICTYVYKYLIINTQLWGSLEFRKPNEF